MPPAALRSISTSAPSNTMELRVSDAGGPLQPDPFTPVLRGGLLEGGADRFLRGDLQGAVGHLDQLIIGLPGPPVPSPAEGFDLEGPPRHDIVVPKSLLGLGTLDAMQKHIPTW